MPKRAKTLYKYRCLELMCNTIHRKDKWLDHCKKKHGYKFKNNLKINYKVIEVKIGDGAWKKYIPNPSSSTTAHDDAATSTPDVSQRTSSDEVSLPIPDGIGSGIITLRSDKSGHEHIGPKPHCISTLRSSNILKRGRPTNNDFEQNQEEEIQLLGMADCSPTACVQEERLPHYSKKCEELEYSSSSISTHIPTHQHQSDPASFANLKLAPEDINLALELEKQDLTSIIFPATDGRKFNPSWKNDVLPNKCIRPRKWLVYSQEKDAIFCLPCTLFALPTERSIWGTTGYRGWIEHRGDRDIRLHETSKNHISAEVSRIQWISQKRIDSNLAQQSNKAITHNREVLSVVIDCCRYLSEEMIAFRKNDVLEGKLLGLFRLIGKYSPDARVYLQKIDKARTENVKLGSNFLSYRNIFDLINIMSDIVVDKIIKSINLTNIYSIILDSTQDVSKKECSTVLVRYVEHIDAQGGPKPNIKPEERLIKVFTSGDTTGKNLFTELMKCLSSLNLDPEGIVGQSMDGAGNMRGHFKGLKSLIVKEYPKAFYVWCCSHRFALVVEQSMDICPEMRNLFSVLEELHVFMSGHKRHHILMSNLDKGATGSNKRRLKRVQTTRWSSRNDSLQTVLTCFETIKQTLQEISVDKKSDTTTRAKAAGLFKQMNDFEMVSAMHIATSVFKFLFPVTICLQSKTIDYSIVPKVILETKNKLASMRRDETWEKIKLSIVTFVEEQNVPLSNQRVRKRKRFLDELSVDEMLEDPYKRMKVEVYLKVIDSLFNQLDDRFPDSSLAMVAQMALFSHEGILKLANEKKNGLDLGSSSIQDLSEYYDLDKELIIEELETFTDLYNAIYSDIDISDILTEKRSPKSGSTEKTEPEPCCSSSDECQHDGSDHNKEEKATTDEVREKKTVDDWVKRGFIRPYRCLLNLSGFPHLTIMYRTLLSLPVTSCSAERTMSRLKIIKNRLRSTMGDSWLSSLLILSSEKDILKQISNEEIINKFALSSIQRKKLLCPKF